MKKFIATLMLTAAVAASAHAGETYQASEDVVATVKDQFPGIVEDNVWMNDGAGVNCRGCGLIWFEDTKTMASWVCNFTWRKTEGVYLKKCWKRHA
jgi:antibiotic biosynthesis monooxygenase (ABM) superfamily enzyme